MNFMSIATVSLNSVDDGKATTGLGRGLLNHLHVSHCSVMWSINASIDLSFVPDFLMSCLSLSAPGWANCLCNLSNWPFRLGLSGSIGLVKREW